MLAIEQQPRAIEPRWHISASRAVGLVMAVVAAVLLGLAGLGMDADTLHIHTQTPNTGAPTPAPAGGDYGAHAGFSIEVLHKPEGCAEAQRVENGQTIAVKYRANLENGEVFAEQLEDPYEFVVGAGQVIAGWEKGVQKMCFFRMTSLYCLLAAEDLSDENMRKTEFVHSIFKDVVVRTAAKIQ